MFEHNLDTAMLIQLACLKLLLQLEESLPLQPLWHSLATVAQVAKCLVAAQYYCLKAHKLVISNGVVQLGTSRSELRPCFQSRGQSLSPALFNCGTPPPAWLSLAASLCKIACCLTLQFNNLLVSAAVCNSLCPLICITTTGYTVVHLEACWVPCGHIVAHMFAGAHLHPPTYVWSAMDSVCWPTSLWALQCVRCR
jgi:hypothetical protein